MKFAVMPAIGIFLVLVSVRLRAGGRLSTDFCALWGGAGMLLIFAAALPPVRALTGGLGMGAALLLCGIFLVFLWGSMRLSMLLAQRQERRMERTLQRDDKKSLLFVVNTLGEGSAEVLLLQVLRDFHDASYEVFLYAVVGQGELFDRLPDDVNVLNSRPGTAPVVSVRGRRRMIGNALKAFVKNGGLFHKACYTVRALASAPQKRRLLLWRVMAEGASRFPVGFDMAVAWMEGGAVYYTADYVKADKKAALIHAEYTGAGDARAADRNCWEPFSPIFAVSEDVRRSFEAACPEYASRLRVFSDEMDLTGTGERKDSGVSDECQREPEACEGSPKTESGCRGDSELWEQKGEQSARR